MMVLVDTPVWSIAFRRRRGDLRERQRGLREVLENLIAEGRVALLGAIRQELLSGIREERQFQRLRNLLRAFPDVDLSIEDYEEAARFGNLCRTAGVATSPVDLLICAVAHRRDWQILTVDQDFVRYGKHLPIRLLDVT
ncbi:MAG: PIN domain-containing protein [Acidobacteriaceae bacterium]